MKRTDWIGRDAQNTGRVSLSALTALALRALASEGFEQIRENSHIVLNVLKKVEQTSSDIDQASARNVRQSLSPKAKPWGNGNMDHLKSPR